MTIPKGEKTPQKCKTLLNMYAMLHFSYSVLLSGDHLLSEETQDGSFVYLSFEIV